MQTAIIPFEGVNLVSVFDEKTNQRYVAVNPIIDYFGLDRRGQRRKLERLAKEKGVDIKSLPLETKGGIQETLVINVDHLPAFLYSIQQSRVKPELREKLRKFQIQTTKIINNYWNNSYSTKNLPEYVLYGKTPITPQRAEIIEKVSKFIKDVQAYDPIKAVRMMNQLLKRLGEKPIRLPIPPEEYLSQYDWLTTDEVAMYFGVSTEAVRKWIKQRKIFAIRYKGRLYISRNEFIYFARRKDINNRPALKAY
ncbi:phage antirepressor N-terminal domain-containing protein [Persephonella sp.]